MSDLPSVESLRGAYEGLESHFPTAAARESYRAAMLMRSAPQADFLEPLVDGASILEVGCGNGRLLIELARRGRLRQGTGVDIAQSRVEFAREWGRDLELDQLRFEPADVLAMETGHDRFDAILCITGAFGYFEPLHQGAAAVLVQRWAAALNDGGLLVLELYPHSELVRLLDVAGGSLKVWRELEEGDPWRFYLSDMCLVDRTLIHHKTFIHRTGNEVDSGRAERLRLYEEAEITQLLAATGFTDIELHQGWSRSRYDGGETMVVTARRLSC